MEDSIIIEKSLTLEELLDLGERAEKGEQTLIYCTPLKDFAKVFKFGIMFFGTDDYCSWEEIKENYGKLWEAYACPPIGREKWKPCELCESCTNCWFCMNSETGRPCINCDEYSKFSPVSYCRYCGRPLTSEAWKQLEKRLRGGIV